MSFDAEEALEFFRLRCESLPLPQSCPEEASCFPMMLMHALEPKCQTPALVPKKKKNKAKKQTKQKLKAKKDKEDLELIESYIQPEPPQLLSAGHIYFQSPSCIMVMTPENQRQFNDINRYLSEYKKVLLANHGLMHRTAVVTEFVLRAFRRTEDGADLCERLSGVMPRVLQGKSRDPLWQLFKANRFVILREAKEGESESGCALMLNPDDNTFQLVDYAQMKAFLDKRDSAHNL